MTNKNASEVLEPSKQSLDFPTPSIAPQRSAILRLGFLSVRSMRRNHFSAFGLQRFIQRITIVCLIANQSLRLVFRKAGFQRGLDQGYFMRRSTSNGYGDRKTSAVCHCHELRTFPSLGLSHPFAPLFAMTKVPSMKHSLRSKPPRSFMSFTNVLRMPANTPDRTHSWKRRWHVWYDGYRSGKSCHGAPVRIIHKMPFKISQSSLRGLPRPPAFVGGTGINGFTTFHCSSVRSMGLSPHFGLSPVYHF